MTRKAMDRREFLQHGLMAASLVAAGRLPLLAAGAGNGSGIDPDSDPYAVKPMRNYLATFSPSDMSLPRQSYRLTYDIVHWNWGRNGRGTQANSVIGQVTIDRTGSDDRVVYEVAQTTRVGGVDNRIEARITCRSDGLNSVQMWRLKSDEVGPDGRIDPLSELVEEGRCEKGKIRIEGDKYHYDYTAAHPVVTQWHVPDLLMRQSGPRLRLSFDLLQDLSLFKPNQRLVYDGQTEVPVENGRTVTLETYAQTGEGILPIHYLLDAEGRPQLVTCGFLSWALTGNHAGLRPTPSRRPLRPKAR